MTNIHSLLPSNLSCPPPATWTPDVNFDKWVLICKVSWADLGNKMLSVARSRKAELPGRPLLGIQARPEASSSAPAAQTRNPAPVPSPNGCGSPTSRRSFPVGNLCLGCERSKLPEASPGVPVHRWAATWCAPRRRTTVWAAGRGGGSRKGPPWQASGGEGWVSKRRLIWPQGWTRSHLRPGRTLWLRVQEL